MASITRRVAMAATLLLSTGWGIACGGSSANAAPPAVATSVVVDDATVGLIEHHRYHHHGGVTLFIAMSLDTLGVSPEQRVAVEKIRTDLHARMEPARAAEQNLVAILADELAVGSMDAAKVDAGVAQATAAAAQVHDASVDSLNELHRVLTPPQRAALVDKVESHWAVWQEANAEETEPVKAGGGQLTRFATEFGLTADQVDKVRATLGEGMKSVPRLNPQEIVTQLHAFSDAFRSEPFDAKALTTVGRANANMVGWGAARMAHFVETVSPVLTPDQRAKFAERLREHATHDPSTESPTP